MTPADEYAFCIGKIGLAPDDYFALTPAETAQIVEGWEWRNQKLSANFRELFTLQYNQFAKGGRKKRAKILWPLELIDKGESRFESAEDEFKWRAKMIEWGKEQNFFKN